MNGPLSAAGTARLLVDARAQLGEGVLWHPDEQRLYWTDIDAATLWRARPDGSGLEHWAMPDRLGSFAFCDVPGRLLLGLAKGVALFDLDTGTVGPVTPVEPEVAGTRINDGRCDRQGRFVFGMYQADEAHGAPGGFYRVGPGLQVEHLPLPPAKVANCQAFSPDGTRLYVTDSPSRVIRVVEYHADGRLGEAREFARLRREDGFPDGATVDAEGRLWVAAWAGACVICFGPDGVEQARIAVPASQVTCPAFGGPALDRLFIVSARKTLDEATLQRLPLAGGVFVADALPLPRVRGLPEARFRTTAAG